MMLRWCGGGVKVWGYIGESAAGKWGGVERSESVSGGELEGAGRGFFEFTVGMNSCRLPVPTAVNLSVK